MSKAKKAEEKKNIQRNLLASNNFNLDFKKSKTSLSERKVKKHNLLGLNINNNELDSKNLSHIKFSELKRNTNFKANKSINKLMFEQEPDHDLIFNSAYIIFQKFVIYYKYENIFHINTTNLNNLEEEEEAKRQKDIKNDNNNFIFKLDKELYNLFSKYKVVKTKEGLLSSFGLEGSYLLTFSYVWIMYIKSLIEKSNKDFGKILFLFEKALEHEANAYVLFDYFMHIISKELDQNAILKCQTDSKIPDLFVDIYKENKEKILEQIGSIGDIESINESLDNGKRFTFNYVEDNISSNNTNDINNTITNNMEDNEETKMHNSNDNIKLNIGIDNNDNKNETKIIEFNNTKIENKQDSSAKNTIAKDIETEIQKIKIKNICPFDNIVKDDCNLGKENNPDCVDDENINNGEECDLDRSFLSDDNNYYLKECFEEGDGITRSESQKAIEETKKNKSKNKSTTKNSSNNNKNINSIYKKKKNNLYQRRQINLEEIIEEASITHSDFRKSGNFAIFEISSKSKAKISSNFILTPLKKEFSTFSEKKTVKEDLEEAKKDFIDFIYKPYDENLHQRIKESKRLSFSKYN